MNEPNKFSSLRIKLDDKLAINALLDIFVTVIIHYCCGKRIAPANIFLLSNIFVFSAMESYNINIGPTGPFDQLLQFLKNPLMPYWTNFIQILNHCVKIFRRIVTVLPQFGLSLIAKYGIISSSNIVV